MYPPVICHVIKCTCYVLCTILRGTNKYIIYSIYAMSYLATESRNHTCAWVPRSAFFTSLIRKAQMRCCSGASCANTFAVICRFKNTCSPSHTISLPSWDKDNRWMQLLTDALSDAVHTKEISMIRTNNRDRARRLVQSNALSIAMDCAESKNNCARSCARLLILRSEHACSCLKVSQKQNFKVNWKACDESQSLPRQSP